MSLFYYYLFKNMSKHSVKTLCQQQLDPLVEGTEGMCQPLPLTYDKSIVDFIPVRPSERDESAKNSPGSPGGNHPQHIVSSKKRNRVVSRSQRHL